MSVLDVLSEISERKKTHGDTSILKKEMNGEFQEETW
jgi:hypothetical protein